MKALKESDEDKHKELCTKIREDGAYVEAGENDNLLVQKVSADPGALGVLGYSFLEENADRVAPVSIAGVAPTEATISDLSYPGSRRLYIYVKGEHIAAKPAIKQFIEAYSKAWSKGGLLEKRGLVPLAAARSAGRDRAGDRADAARPREPEVIGGDERHDAHHCARRGPGDRRRRRPVRPQSGERAARAAAAASTACPTITRFTSRSGRRLPALLFLAVWTPVQTGLVDQAVLASPAGQQLPDFDLARDTILTEAKEIAAGDREAGFNPESARAGADLRRGQRPLCRDRRRHRHRHRAARRASWRCAGSRSISAPAAGSNAG